RVSAFYPDLRFVPADRAEEALKLLIGLAEDNRV
ncbi:ribonuclease H family protein, partial [Mesorhizobium sp. M7A.F.Ca.CA.002.15.1.1]